MLRTSADQVFLKEYLPQLVSLFVEFVQILADRTMTCLNSSTLAAYQNHVVLLNFGSEYK